MKFFPAVAPCAHQPRRSSLGRRSVARLPQIIAMLAIAVAALACTAPASPPGSLPRQEQTPNALSPSPLPTVSPSPSARPVCPNPGGGECLGTLTAGTYRTSTFELPLTYEISARWQNVEDLPGNFLLVPPDQHVAGVDAGITDYVGVYLRSAAASRDCSSELDATQPEPGVGNSPQAIADELRVRPGLLVTAPRNVTVGGLTGVVIDIRMDEAWTGTCFYSAGAPVVPLIKGLPPSDFDHSMIEGIETRLYLLAHDGGTLGIEIQMANPTRLDEYAAVAESISFGD